jgi:signal transduction histidine kinase
MQATLEVLGDLTASDDEVQGLLGRLWQSSNWMGSLIANLETLAQLDDDDEPIAARPTPVIEVVEPAVAVAQPLLDRRRQPGRLIVANPTARIDADPQLLGQALVNLLTNASAYSPPGEPIDITIRTNGECVEIRVTDRGPGVLPHERERIFDRYARGSAGERQRRGLGLGLHLARAIVERHGGAIGVDSVVGQGAAFWIALPSL